MAELMCNSPTPGLREKLTTLVSSLAEAAGAGTVVTLATALPAELNHLGEETRLVVDHEIIRFKVKSATELEVLERHAENSSAALHNAGAEVFYLLTAGAINAQIAALYLKVEQPPTSGEGRECLRLGNKALENMGSTLLKEVEAVGYKAFQTIPEGETSIALGAWTGNKLKKVSKVGLFGHEMCHNAEGTLERSALGGYRNAVNWPHSTSTVSSHLVMWGFQNFTLVNEGNNVVALGDELAMGNRLGSGTKLENVIVMGKGTTYPLLYITAGEGAGTYVGQQKLRFFTTAAEEEAMAESETPRSLFPAVERLNVNLTTPNLGGAAAGAIEVKPTEHAFGFKTEAMAQIVAKIVELNTTSTIQVEAGAHEFGFKTQAMAEAAAKFIEAWTTEEVKSEAGAHAFGFKTEAQAVKVAKWISEQAYRARFDERFSAFAHAVGLTE